jgi:hypothetical protein
MLLLRAPKRRKPVQAHQRRLPAEGLEPVKVIIPDDSGGSFAKFASELRRLGYQE